MKAQMKAKTGAHFSEQSGGRIMVVGLGPGGPQHLTPAAQAAVERADLILGYRTYLKLIAHLAPATPREGHGMRQEVARVQRAVELAQAGRQVALVSSGDAGIYGMAGLVYDVLREQETAVEVEVVPGMSALNAAASLVGAPLMSDFAVISLSDHLTPLPQILNRLQLAAAADFVLCLYNPKGRRRVEPFARTCAILADARAPDTPVGIVRAASREGQQVRLSTVAALPEEAVDMLTLLIVGNSRSYIYRGRMVTPRGYEQKYQLGEGE